MALDSLEQSGKSSAFSLNAGWLLEAYAQINGYQAYPRLRRMMENPKLAFLQGDIATSTAAALALTSYVHVSRRPTRRFHCDRKDAPSDVLDQLVLGWFRADRARVEESLGPEGQVALKRLLESEERFAVRMGLLPDDHQGAVAVGYRFEQAGGWMAPASLIGLDAGYRNEIPAKGQTPEFQTVFTSASGKDCGAYTVRFAMEGTQEGGGRRYVVDNSDLAGLLRLITACAMRNE
ncbi:hypothetical protein [Paludibaculum fermentans]|uniref:hypothetical protein n=1 Tax=Paludibaculum fermentans TaxID=1473598 RepID=UPI003EB84556